MAGIPEHQESVDYDLRGRAVCSEHQLRVCHRCCMDFTLDGEDSDDGFYNPHRGFSLHDEDDEDDGDDEDDEEDEDRVFILSGPLARFIPQQDQEVIGPQNTLKIKVDYNLLPKPDTPNNLQWHTCKDCQATWLIGAQGITAATSHPSHHTLHHIYAGTRRSLLVTIDGACPENGKSPTNSSIGVYFGPESRHNISRLLDNSHPTNQTAELSAAIEAMRHVRTDFMPERADMVQQKASKNSARDVCRLRLVLITDSAYLVDCICTHMVDWKLNSETQTYKNKSGEIVKNSPQFIELQKEVELLSRIGIQVQWYLVPRQFNEKADGLANAALRKAVPNEKTRTTAHRS